MNIQAIDIQKYYGDRLSEAIAMPEHRTAAVKAHRAYLLWQQPYDRKVQNRFLALFYKLPVGV